MECVFQKEGYIEMLKQENLNVMCTFSSHMDNAHMDNVFVLINGIFRFIAYPVDVIAKVYGLSLAH